MIAVEMAGRRYGRLLVTSYAGRFKGGGAAWSVRCDCGTEKVLQGGELRRGYYQSCGCWRREKLLRIKHGGCVGGASLAYVSWRCMVGRCHDPDNESFPEYGARGISVCAQWRNDFGAFLQNLGPRPSRLYSIDRLDSDGNYEPGNVRWATVKEQNRNRKHYNVFVTVGGNRRLLVEACDEYNLPSRKVRNRLAAGWSPDEAFGLTSRPFQKRGKS